MERVNLKSTLNLVLGGQEGRTPWPNSSVCLPSVATVSMLEKQPPEERRGQCVALKKENERSLSYKRTALCQLIPVPAPNPGSQ